MRVTPEATAVADANLAFYRALEARDLETMARVWYHDESVSCVHPGWHRLDGWDEVERSWENIFTNSRPWAVSFAWPLAFPWPWLAAGAPLRSPAWRP